METRLGGVSLTPWGGLHVKGLTLEQPPPLKAEVAEPLLSIASARAWPVWKAWLHRRWEVSSVELESPRAVIPLQLALHFSRLAPPPPPVVAVNKPMEPTSPVVSLPLGQTPVIPLFTIPVPSPLAAPSTTPPVLKVTLAPPPDPVAPSCFVPTCWISIRGGSVAIVSAGNPIPLLEAAGIQTSVPAAGGPADSSLQVSTLGSLGTICNAPIQIPLRWQAPVLYWGPTPGHSIAGISARFGGKIGLVPGLPILAEGEIPAQSDLKWNAPGLGQMEVHHLRAAGRFTGYLATASSWQGDLQAEAADIRLSTPAQPVIGFDRAALTAFQRGGVVTCPDARLVGDTLSFLGNATAIPDGRFAGVLRIVAEPSIASGITARFQHGGRRMAFAQLGTPDRLAADVQWIANTSGSAIQLGAQGDTVPPGEVFRLLKDHSPSSP
ncbi:hypothetical protein [Luteolibacter sp. LG18]|uniref:hypothetical protein n=1 Tax=Luteolibacter sp. LG18 TaxID=2819286 RepID=UPI0030C6EDB3